MHVSGYQYVHSSRYGPLALALGVTLAAVPLASADPIGRLSPYGVTPGAEPGPDPGGGSGGYSPRVNPLRGVYPNDRASTGLFMYDTALNVNSINTGGDAPVQRGLGGVNIGLNRNGTGQINAYWDEIVSGNTQYLRCVVSTSNGEPIVPAGSTLTLPGGGTAPAVFWSWRFGTADPVDFMPFVTQVRMTRASVSFSADLGQSFFSTFQHTSTIPNRNNWNPASDDGELLASVGDGTNYLMLQYTIEVTPSPGTLALLSGGLFTLTRRRRR